MEIRIFDNSLKELSDELDLSQQRSFLYGDAHFTTAKVIDGETEFIDLHLNRLRHAHKTLKFNPILWQKLHIIMEQIASSLKMGIVKVHISRGLATRGYGQLARTQPYIFISTTELAPDFSASIEQPVTLAILETKLGHQPMLAGIKHCNRLEQVLIASELEQKQLEDGLVLDINNNLIETSKANVFWFDGNKWSTPSLANSGIAGVMREHIISKVDVEIANVNIDVLLENVKAMFICNSLIGIRAVSNLGDLELDLNSTHHVKKVIFND